MKITKAQKEAVISLLKEKFEEKNKVIREAYVEKHKAEIEININKYLALQSEAKELLEKFKELSKNSHKTKDFVNGDLMVDEFRVNYNFYSCPWNAKQVLTHEYTKEELIGKVFVEPIETPNYCLVERELELASLGKDFDLDGFLAKYLPQ